MCEPTRKIQIISTASEKHRNTDIVTAVVVIVFIAIAMANVIVDMAVAIVVFCQPMDDGPYYICIMGEKTDPPIVGDDSAASAPRVGNESVS